MKQKLLILSDIHGFQNCNWIEGYVKQLSPIFDIKLYDVKELAGIEKNSLNSIDEVHRQFVVFGIEKAVSNLITKEKERTTVLAFSIGGTIAWKGALNGLPVTQMVLVSSTRLRFEKEKPNCKIQLIYAEDDVYKPNNDWANKLGLELKIIENKGHDFYTEKGMTHVLSSSLLNNFKIENSL